MATTAKATPAARSGLSRKAPTASGMRLTMPAKMMKLMPLPMPRSVISSPIHMARMVPAVRVMICIQVSRLAKAKLVIAGSPPVAVAEESRAR